MGAVQADISISLDGFVTRPNTDQHPGLGEGGRPLHVWVNDETGHKLLDDTFAAAGAVITSRTVFDVTGGWGDDGFYKMPVFVLTHRPHDEIVRGPTTFTFVTDGIESAVAQAKAAAGDRNVHIMGGASVIQQELNAGLVDELHLPVAPLLLGDGTPLFAALSRIALEPLGVIESTHAIHLRYRVARRG
jgi:dihydrofolate reductase